MRILLLTRYDRLGASSRVRTLQYLPHFASLGWSTDVAPFFSNTYLEKLYLGQPRWRETIQAYAHRIRDIVEARSYDLLWVEKELFPYLPAIFERLLLKLSIPYVADYDDAIFHNYDKNPLRLVRSLLGRKIDLVMRHASLVVAGNEYLAQRARLAGSHHVEIIPTVVDLQKYGYRGQNRDSNKTLVVGWIGTPKTSHYLHSLKNIFRSLKADFAVRFAAVGASVESLGDLPVEPWPWSEDTEIESLQKFDIGIMPLEDSDWERGKCGYKLIQYMACGVPVVASPVGVNSKIVKPGVNGFLAKNNEDWRRSLTVLLTDANMRQTMGFNARKNVETRYCLQTQAPRLEGLMRLAVKGCL